MDQQYKPSVNKDKPLALKTTGDVSCEDDNSFQYRKLGIPGTDVPIFTDIEKTNKSQIT